MTQPKTKKSRHRNRHGWIGLAVLTLLALSTILPPNAEASHYRYRYFHHSRHSPFYYGGYHGSYYGGYGYGGYGYGGYGYGGYGHHRRAQLHGVLNQARLAGVGALDLGVRPKRVEVFVDGEYIGRNGQFDGAPNYLWLEKGSHEITFYREGYMTATRELTVQAGLIKDVKFRLQAGDSELAEELAQQLSDYYREAAA